MRPYILFLRLLRVVLPVGVLLLSSLVVDGQTTVFTYQGKLADAGTPANGSYDFQFKLWDALSGGSGIGSASVNGVMVTNGVFTVNLDFGACPLCFNGSNRFLAISVKPTSGSSFTDLSPRQQITSAPYAIKSQNASSADSLSVACVNCVTSSQIASLPAGSGSYIQNTVSQQAASNFNISGDGTVAGTLSANVINASTQFNLGGSRVLSSAGSFNLFAGAGAGDGNTAGSSNAFFGALAGQNNTTGANNSFFGAAAGFPNTTGQQNSFFGSHAGQSTTTGSINSFFGAFAGDANTTGNFNSFFGGNAGADNTTGLSNSFFGGSAGQRNTTGSSNSFFGTNAGFTNTTGQSNAFFGFSAGSRSTTGNGNAFFGSDAGTFNTTGSNNVFVGRDAGGGNTTGDSNSFFGNASGLHSASDKRNVMLGAGADFRSSQATSTSAFGGDENLFVGYQAGGAALRRNASAIGTNSFVACDDCMVLGTTNVKVGIGMTTPQQSLSVDGGLVIDQANLSDGTLPAGTNKALTFGSGSGEGIVSKRTAGGNQFGMDFYTNFFNRVSINNNGNVGIGTNNPLARLSVEGDTRISGKLTVSTLSAATAIHLCSNAIFELSLCSSSIRYKTNVLPFNSGLELINRLRPVTFDWIATRERDLGLIAEEVEKVDPLLVTRNRTGQIEGVKYDQLGIVFINSIKEQQSQIIRQQTRLDEQQSEIDRQLRRIERQQDQIESLLKIVCLDHPGADLCKPKE